MKHQYATPAMDMQKPVISQNIAATVSNPDNEIGVDVGNV